MRFIVLDLEFDLLQLVFQPSLLLHQLDVQLLLSFILLFCIRVVSLMVACLHGNHVPLHHPHSLLQLHVGPFCQSSKIRKATKFQIDGIIPIVSLLFCSVSISAFIRSISASVSSFVTYKHGIKTIKK